MTEFVDILIERLAENPDITEAGLARKAGLDNSTIRQMIKFRRNPRVDHQHPLVCRLRCSRPDHCRLDAVERQRAG